MRDAANLNPHPSLDQLVAAPRLAEDLSAKAAADLLARLAGLQTLLLSRLAAATHKEANGDKEELLTVREAAAFLKVPRAHVYELCRRAEIPTLRLGKYIRIPREALLRRLK